MLTAAQVDARKGRLTASRVACLMVADEARIMDLWREMTADPTWLPEDLSGVWAVQLGEATESLNLRWFIRDYGEVSRIGDVVTMESPNYWAAATLDGWSEKYLCPVECKHTGGFENLSKIIDRYQPQMHWQMIVTNARQCALSVIMGASEPVVEFIPYDEEYGDELWRRASAFMACVRSKTPPVTISPAPPPVIAEKIYDMAGSNSWAEAASLWLDHLAAKRICVDAEKDLKGQVPDDAKKCHGHGVQVIRDRANRLSLREAKQ